MPTVACPTVMACTPKALETRMRTFSPPTEVRTIMRTDWSVKPTSEPLVLVAAAAVSAVPQLPVHLARKEAGRRGGRGGDQRRSGHRQDA